MWLIGVLHPVPTVGAGGAEGFIYFGALLVVMAAIAYGLHLIGNGRSMPVAPPRGRHIGTAA
jgi:hypothetical protein